MGVLYFVNFKIFFGFTSAKRYMHLVFIHLYCFLLILLGGLRLGGCNYFIEIISLIEE